MLRILLEACLFLLLCGAVGLGANSIHPHGLGLTKDYFLADQAPGAGNRDQNLPNLRDTEGEEKVRELLAQWSFQPWILKDVDENLEDAKTQNGVLYLDARKEDSFKAGHIPGAVHFYRFGDMQDQLTEDMKFLLLSSEKVMIYCGGGDCEDSLNLGIELSWKYKDPEEGQLVTPDQIGIYLGGMTEWQTERPNQIEKD